MQKINNGNVAVSGIPMNNNTTVVTALKVGFKF
jgi:hypothetical protein